MLKKGEWSLTTIAAFILIIIVLVILIVAFREQFAKLITSFSDIITGVKEANGKELAQEAIQGIQR